MPQQLTSFREANHFVSFWFLEGYLSSSLHIHAVMRKNLYIRTFKKLIAKKKKKKAVSNNKVTKKEVYFKQSVFISSLSSAYLNTSIFIINNETASQCSV